MRTIKTYANGRFYDTLNKRYMSKDQLVALVDKKEAIKIIMHNTGSRCDPVGVEENGCGGEAQKRV